MFMTASHHRITTIIILIQSQGKHGLDIIFPFSIHVISKSIPIPQEVPFLQLQVQIHFTSTLKGIPHQEEWPQM